MRRLASAAVSTILIICATNYIGIGKIIDSFSLISPLRLLIGGLMMQIAFLSNALRWGKLIGKDSRHHWGYYLKSLFFNFFTPSALGSDGFRLAVLKSKAYSKRVIISSLLRERFIGLHACMSLLLISAIMLRPYIENGGGFKSLNTTATVTSTIFITSYYGINILRRSKSIHRKVGAYTRKAKCLRIKNIFGYFVGTKNTFSFERDLLLHTLTLSAQIIWAFSVYIICSGLNNEVSMITILYAVLITELSRLIPVSAQGLGVREAVFAYVLSGFGYNSAEMYASGAVCYIMLGVIQCLNWPIGSVVDYYCKAK